ncbi:MAG: hypothetical protein JKY34_13415 [Kordiimonadaceae bacterium]|nr:hypothetical protein [Kordiimonadaceae bacterium]
MMNENETPLYNNAYQRAGQRAGKSARYFRSFCIFGTVAGALFSTANNSASAQFIDFKSDVGEIKFNLEGTSAVFTQSNSWFGRDIENIGVESNGWSEFALTPKMTFSLNNVFGGTLYGGLSGVGTKTFGESADGLAVGFDDPSAFTLEEAYGGWRMDFQDGDFLEVQGGNFNYQIGNGFLALDGGNDGGDRGGFYLGARTAFRTSALARWKTGNLLVEGFYLENNPRRDAVSGALAGTNIEYDFGDWLKIGGTYLNLVDVDDDAAIAATTDLVTYDFRADLTPFDGFKLSGEYATQSGDDTFEGVGWWARADLTFQHLPMEPSLAYRYSVVTGDDPDTVEFEGFQPLAYGFDDYQTWYQGEIAGNWLFANTNMKTHLIQGAASLTGKLSLTASWLNFEIDEPAALGITNEKFGNEVDIFLDYQVNDNLFVSGVFANFFPNEGAEEFSGGDKTWSHFMFYLNVSY